MGGKTANKAGYFDKLKGLLEEYKSIFIVTVDNVSSQQMHNIRKSLRGEGVVLMGKNTMVWLDHQFRPIYLTRLAGSSCYQGFCH
jgi:large subunit ribosomal protein LP0